MGFLLERCASRQRMEPASAGILISSAVSAYNVNGEWLTLAQMPSRNVIRGGQRSFRLRIDTGATPGWPQKWSLSDDPRTWPRTPSALVQAAFLRRTVLVLYTSPLKPVRHARK